MKRILNVPYLSQTDNKLFPTGTCNLTSVAMCLKFYGIVGNGQGQLEDQLTRFCLDKGLSRHSPIDLVKVLKTYGVNDTFSSSGTIAMIQKQINNGNPAIIHGYFTREGHIITVIGYDDNGLIVHDPWGEWFNWGYIKNSTKEPERGKSLHYSYGMINQLCSPESNPSANIWVHLVSKDKK